MIGVYFSGTGNSKHCTEKFLQEYDAEAKAFSIEDERILEQIEQQKELIFAYPVYYSNLPKIVRDFIVQNAGLWNGKSIYIIATMGLFSGDGAGLSARLFRKYGATITGGLHLKMPDCIGDVKALKKSLNENKNLVKAAELKIEDAAGKYLSHSPTQDGLSLWSHFAGLFGQRLYFYKKTLEYTDKLKVDRELCVGCGTCAEACPLQNILIENGKAAAGGSCTMCYRCINHCPKKAITLLGNRVIEQCRIENYIE